MPRGKKTLMPVSKTQVDKNQGKAIMSLKKDVTKLKKVTKNAMNLYDTAPSVQPGTTAIVAQVSAVGGGTGLGQRVGDSVVMTSFECKGTFIPNTSTVYDACRYIVLKWKPDLAGATIGAGQILAVPSNINSAYNKNYRKDFTVLYDKIIDLSASNGTKTFKFRRSLKNTLATYNGSGAGSYGKNTIWYLALCTDNVNKSTIAFYTRLNYHD